MSVLVPSGISDQYILEPGGDNMLKKSLQSCVLLVLLITLVENRVIVPRSTDNSVRGYLTERICWWNEVCKEEFQSHFKCQCPEWSFCRAPGRYYNAYCSMTATGYIWSQPGINKPTQAPKPFL